MRAKGTTGPAFARPEIVLMYVYICTIGVQISDGNADFASVYALF